MVEFSEAGRKSGGRVVTSRARLDPRMSTAAVVAAVGVGVVVIGAWARPRADRPDTWRRSVRQGSRSAADKGGPAPAAVSRHPHLVLVRERLCD